MSEHVLDHVARGSGESGSETSTDMDTWVKSYGYLRTAIIALLIGLGVAVAFQTARQGWHLLGSVSAYYYTPAQAIFVGALIGLGASMIALKGTNAVEDVFLNLGGMFAMVVAIVPTSRGEDYRTAVGACQHARGPLLTQKAGNGLNCPTVDALTEATRANVDNNMFALLVVGALALLATVLLGLRHRRSSRRAARSGAPSTDPGMQRAESPQKFWWGFMAAVAVWAVAAVASRVYPDEFLRHAHIVAATGLFLCIVVVAAANAFRRRTNEAGDGLTPQRSVTLTGAATSAVIRPAPRDPYAWIAQLMVAAAGVGAVLVLSHRLSLFWLEIVVACLFVVFWTVQTIERLPR
jgi:hypothetical protein